MTKITASDEEIFGNRLDDDCDGNIDCDDDDRAEEIGCSCNNFKDSCSSNSECCSGKCLNGICR